MRNPFPMLAAATALAVGGCAQFGAEPPQTAVLSEPTERLFRAIALVNVENTLPVAFHPQYEPTTRQMQRRINRNLKIADLKAPDRGLARFELQIIADPVAPNPPAIAAGQYRFLLTDIASGEPVLDAVYAQTIEGGRPEKAAQAMIDGAFAAFLADLDRLGEIRTRAAVDCRTLNPQGIRPAVLLSTPDAVGYNCPRD